MRNKKTTPSKDYNTYNNKRYDEMKSLLDKSRRLSEQTEEIPLDRDKEKTKTYEVSSGKIIVHGYTTPEISLTDEGKKYLPRNYGRIC